MKIEKLIIKNFRSYYGTKVFEFQDGLNLIIGANGDGKSTFYDAINWAFTTNDGSRNSSSLSSESQVSAKLFKQLNPGESEEVRVEVVMSSKKGEQKSVYKSFIVTKNADGSMEIDNWKHKSKLNGLTSNDEDDFSSGYLLEGEGWFPHIVRKYSMFQGEGALRIFDETDNLRNLIRLFSDIKDLDPIKDFSRYAKETSDRAMKNADAKKDSVDRDIKMKKLDKEILENHLGKAKDKLAALQRSLQLQEGELGVVESLMEDIEHVYKLKQKIREKESQISEISQDLDRNYDYISKLLSDKWILKGFAPILESYLDKLNDASQRKTQFINIYHMQKGERMAQKKAEAKAREDLKKQIMGLPWYIPDTKTMESMLKSHRCFVCDREMSEDDDAYKFMQKRLNEALEILQPKNTKEEKEEEIPYPFPANNIDELHSKGLFLQRRMKDDILPIPDDMNSFEDRIKRLNSELDLLHSQKDGLDTELTNYLAQRDTGHDLTDLADNMSNWRTMFSSKSTTETEIHKLLEVEIPRLESAVAKATEDYNKELAKHGGKSEIAEINEMFDLLGNALDVLENSLYYEIMEGINRIGNVYLSKLNIDDFTGELKVTHSKERNKFELNLYDKTNTPIKAPNTSLRTTMYMSALLAISDLAREQYSGNEYPIIFDAPTSSFDAGKDKAFYELFSREIKKQVIIVTKSYLLKDDKSGEFVLDKKSLKNIHCPIYRIHKVSGFDKKDLTTIETEVEKVI